MTTETDGFSSLFSYWSPIQSIQRPNPPISNEILKRQSSNVASQWELALDEINMLLLDHESGKATEQYIGITHSHWVPSNSRDRCANSQCHKLFNFITRHHHCRRCGDLFCYECTTYQRRLNELAHPDPNGKLYKVCQQCFDQGPQTIGQYCSHTRNFQLFKQQKQQAGARAAGKQASHNSVTVSNFRERFNIETECERLKNGFCQNVVRSGMGRALQDLRCLVSTPEWQRSTYWALGNMSNKCIACEKEFGIIRPKKDCCLCGSAVCGDCSSNDLLIYLPDNTIDNSDIYKHINLAIIRIVGCPEKEPEISIYLRVCHQCCEKLKERQISCHHSQLVRQESEESEIVDQANFWSELDKVSRDLRNVQNHIEKHLPRYQELIDALEISSGSPQSLPQSHSNMQILAKAQSDLSDYTTKQVLLIHSLKKVKPTSKGHIVVMRNMIRAQCDNYQETAFQFRLLKRKLEKVTPAEVLSAIQTIVDKNAINSCYLSIKQIAFEVLHLCSKHKMTQVLVKRLVIAEEVVQKDLQATLSKTGEDWGEHETCVTELLRMQLKDHRFIRPSRKLTKSYGVKHIQHIIFERCDIVLRQVYLQLKSKCVDMNFRRSKEVLTKLRQDLPELASNLHEISEDDWELVEIAD